jgi:hypothetical protein
MMLLEFALTCWQTQPDLRIEDAYKWLFHATQGGEHAITSEDGPRTWLDEEWETLTAPKPDELLIEPLRPDGAIVRLHLRPYKAQGGNQEALLQAFIASAQSFKAERDVFVAVWRELYAQLLQGPISAIHRQDWERLDAMAQAEHYSAIHHSQHYERMQQPAYRVLMRIHADRLQALL